VPILFFPFTEVQKHQPTVRKQLDKLIEELTAENRGVTGGAPGGKAYPLKENGTSPQP
jgi:hypothetical protein